MFGIIENKPCCTKIHKKKKCKIYCFELQFFYSLKSYISSLQRMIKSFCHSVNPILTPVLINSIDI